MAKSEPILLEEATLCLSGDERVMDVHLSDGKIVAVGPKLQIDSRVRRINVRGKHVLPGIIDGHVHLREFDFSDREDFFTGTQAAAVGGITTVLDMPNSKPKVITPEDFEARRQRVLERAYVNIGLYVWACAKNIDRLHEFSDLGAIGFKIFTAETGAYDPTFGDYVTSDPVTLFRILEKTGDFGGLTAIHSESQALIGHLEASARTEMPPDIRAYLASRPVMVEDVAVFTETAMAKHTGARIHICHVVGRGTVDFLRWAKQDYYPNVSCEVAPHNLLLNSDQAGELGSIAKFSPPVHSADDQEGLWQGLLDGTIDIIGSDHAPQHEDKKLLSDIWQAPPGSPALDYWVPLVLDQVVQGRLSLQRFVEVTAEIPAKIFGLYPQKGCMLPGADADLVVVDMNRTSRVDPSRFKSKAKYTPFKGWTVRGLPVMTFVGGILVAEEGKVVAQPGTGTLVAPSENTSQPARLVLP